MRLSTLSPEAATQNEMEQAIKAALPEAQVQVTANQPGHFSIVVVSSEFADKSKLACQRLVYRAISSLMSGPSAPVHAIDNLQTRIG